MVPLNWSFYLLCQLLLSFLQIFRVPLRKDLGPLLLSVHTLFLVSVIPSHVFKHPWYANNIKMYISSPNLPSKLQTFISNNLFYISTSMTHCHLNIFKSELGKWQVLVRMWGNLNPCTLLVEMKNGSAAMESSLVVPQKVKQRIDIWPSNSPYRYMPKRTESRHSNKSLYTNVHSSNNHNSKKKMETIQMSKNGWMDKKAGRYIQWNTIRP